MDNSQFRKLVNDTPRADRSSGSGNATSAAAPLLGSRQRSSIPMTPRSVGYNPSSAFAQQAAAYRLQNSKNPPKEKKFRSAAPLGTRLPEGYVDRTKQRDGDEDAATDTDRRMAALMQLVEEGSLTREEAIEQSKAFGGDVGSTHLVKGLDFKLLEKARRGEVELSGEKGADEEDIEDELDKALEKDIAPVEKKRKDLDDDDEAPAQKKKTRAEILEEWKKSKAEAAAKAAAETSLGPKFKKIALKEKKPKKSKDDKVPEPDIAPGKKRKREVGAPVSSKEQVIDNGTVLGMLPPDMPPIKAPPAPEPKEDEDMNIFDDAPDEYDPLAGMQDSDDSDSDEGELGDSPKKKEKEKEKEMPPPAITRPRNYFASSSKDADVSTESIASKPLSGQDLAQTAELSAAIKKASQMRELSKADLDDEEAKKQARHKAMLESSFRDDADVDMGFGESRTFGDDEDESLGVTKKKRKNKNK